MFRPRLPPRLNFTGTLLPALAEFSVGGLSTGEKNPVKGQVALKAFVVPDPSKLSSSDVCDGQAPFGLGFAKPVQQVVQSTFNVLFSVELPALRFNDVHVQVRNIDVTCAQALGRQLARIGAPAGV